MLEPRRSQSWEELTRYPRPYPADRSPPRTMLEARLMCPRSYPVDRSLLRLRLEVLVLHLARRRGGRGGLRERRGGRECRGVVYPCVCEDLAPSALPSSIKRYPGIGEWLSFHSLLLGAFVDRFSRSACSFPHRGAVGPSHKQALRMVHNQLTLRDFVDLVSHPT